MISKQKEEISKHGDNTAMTEQPKLSIWWRATITQGFADNNMLLEVWSEQITAWQTENTPRQALLKA